MALALPGTGSARAPHHRRAPGTAAWLLLAPLVLWLVLFVVIPTLLLVAMSFTQPDAFGRPSFTGFTFENWIRAFEPVYLRIFGASIWYAFLTTILCLVIGFPVAYFIGRAPPNVRNLLLLGVMIPFWISFLIRTYGWISILSTRGFLNAALMATGLTDSPIAMMYTPFAVVLGLVYNFLPFMILPIYGSVEKLDASVVEAAYDLGATPIRAFQRVIIPLTKPGIVAGCFLVFVPAIAMFAITTLMGGGTNPTIGEVIQDQFTAARNQPFGATLGTLLLLVFALGLLFSRPRKAAE